MKIGLYALSAGTFGLGISEFIVMGILPDISSNLGISISLVGHFISAYAIGVCIGAPLTVLLTRSLPPKQSLLWLCIICACGNLLVSVSSGYGSLLLFRFISGLPHGAFFGIGAVVAERIAEKGKVAQAMSITIFGMTIANLVGVPLGTMLCHLFSWRVVFMLNGIWWLVVYAAIFACIPAIHPLPNHGIKGQFSFLKSGNVRLILLTILFGCSGIFCWFSYVSPQMIYKVGFQQQDMTRIMFIAGLGMTIGNLLGGKLGDLWGPARLIKYTQLCVALVLVLIFLPLNFKWASVLLMFIATAGFFMLPSSQQVLLLRNSKGCEMMGAASLQIVFNMGNAIGAYIGGILVEMGWGYQYPALFGATLVIASWFFISIFIHRMGRNNT